MTTVTHRQDRATAAFKAHKENSENSAYRVATEAMPVADKLKVLEALGREEMVGLFKDWSPRVSNRRRRGAPLDQRVSITVTDAERVSLDAELRAVKATGEKTTMSQFIRNRALGSVDINGWRAIAVEALDMLDTYEKHQDDFKARRGILTHLLESEEDIETIASYDRELAEIQGKLVKLVAQNEKRTNRLSGRMSMPEAETIKWRAQRLCLSSSDYLRMMIFSLEPNTSADGHMSLDAKRRFYISIIDVADNGWGEVPTIYNCTQCESYMDEIRRLRDRVDQLQNFS
jgi:hypothetical protein